MPFTVLKSIWPAGAWRGKIPVTMIIRLPSFGLHCRNQWILIPVVLSRAQEPVCVPVFLIAAHALTPQHGNRGRISLPSAAAVNPAMHGKEDGLGHSPGAARE